MARKSFYNKRVRNDDDQDLGKDLTPEQKRKCPAQGCPMLASVFLDGGPWTCRYHAKQPQHVWPKITDYLNEKKRLLNIVRVADAIRPNEFDNLMARNAFELDELVKPAKGESHSQWVARVKDTIYKALRHNTNKITEANEIVLRNTDESSTSWAVNMLTNGALLKRDFKSKKQQLEELQAKQERAA